MKDPLQAKHLILVRPHGRIGRIWVGIPREGQDEEWVLARNVDHAFVYPEWEGCGEVRVGEGSVRDVERVPDLGDLFRGVRSEVE